MAKWSVWVPACVSALSLCACATTSSQSTRATSYAGNPQRMYLLISSNFSQQLGYPFASQTEQDFLTSARKCGVVIDGQVASALDLNPQGALGTALAFKPDVIMAMNFAGGTTNQYGAWVRANIDVRLWQPGTKYLAWHDLSEVTAPPAASVENRAESFTTNLFQRLSADGVLTHCDPSVFQPPKSQGSG